MLIARRKTVEAHAKVIAAALHAAEAAMPANASPRLKTAMWRLHEALADAAQVAGLDLVPLSGGLPKPPAPRED